MLIYAIAAVQALTCLALGILFFRQGQVRLGIAQCAYCFTTIVLFAR